MNTRTQLALFGIALLPFLFTSCSHVHKPGKKQEFHIATVNNNVCKRLKGKVVIYAIFVDSPYTNTWTTHDIHTTLDSIQVAIDWIHEQAAKTSIPLNIELDYHQDDKRVVPINAKLTRKTLSGTLLSINGVKYVDRWADKVGKQALYIFGPDTSTITRNKVKPKDRERLIARLRDVHGTDNVALMYFINNYYTDEISVALHTASDANPEYCIVSFKKPAIIAHEFLHLFGAWDLYLSPFDNHKKTARQKTLAMKEFPNEIMAFAYRGLDSLEISPITRYLIGWDRQLDDHYKQLIVGKKIRVAKY